MTVGRKAEANFAAGTGTDGGTLSGTCIITMSHRNVQPHVSIMLAADSRGHWWGAPTPLPSVFSS